MQVGLLHQFVLQLVGILSVQIDHGLCNRICFLYKKEIQTALTIMQKNGTKINITLRLGGDFIFQFLTEAMEKHYTPVRVMKESPRGSVVLLRHNSSGERFVLRRFLGDSDVYRRLLRVRCRNLPQVMAAAQEGEQVLVLEEYVQGDNLACLLETCLCTAGQTRSIAMDICRALWVLHSLGVVHRDVKPENMILRRGEAVLTDLDASRIVTPEKTSDTVVLGTAGYAPPEQYGLSQTDGRTDIYALGVTMNILLTGCHPSQKQAGGALGRVIRRCTMLSPENRYQSAAQLMEAL